MRPEFGCNPYVFTRNPGGSHGSAHFLVNTVMPGSFIRIRLFTPTRSFTKHYLYGDIRSSKPPGRLLHTILLMLMDIVTGAY